MQETSKEKLERSEVQFGVWREEILFLISCSSASTGILWKAEKLQRELQRHCGERTKDVLDERTEFFQEGRGQTVPQPQPPFRCVWLWRACVCVCTKQ